MNMRNDIKFVKITVFYGKSHDFLNVFPEITL